MNEQTLNPNAKTTLILVFGTSGSGVGTTMNALEDLGFYSIKNLPFNMLFPTLDYLETEFLGKGKIAIGVRVHASKQVQEFGKLKQTLLNSMKLDVLFLKASESVLSSRFASNRRKHPAQKNGESLEISILSNKALLSPLEKEADAVIDTSTLTPHDLARAIETRYQVEFPLRHLYVTFVSFGFKHGLLQSLDSLFDVRFLRNPFFDPQLKHKSGLEIEVNDYIFSDPSAQETLQRLIDWHTWVLPRYHHEGKHYFKIGIGCTGGQHRSVSMVENLTAHFKKHPLENIVISNQHRDLDL